MLKSSIFILHDMPYPDDSGGKKISLGRILKATKNSNVTVIIYNYNSIETILVEEFLNNNSIKVYIYTPKKSDSKISKLVNYFSYFISIKPTYFNKLKDKDFLKFINEKLSVINADEISIETIFLLSVLNSITIKPKKIELVLHNVESEFYKELSKLSSKFYMKLFYYIESLKIKILEKNIFNLLKMYKNLNIVYLTNNDRLTYEKEFDFQPEKGLLNHNHIFLNKRISHTPNIKNPYFLFPGSLTFPPNKEGVKWFLQEYIKRNSNIRVVITGKINEQIKNEFIHISCVEFTGFISENELLKLYENCICVISPIISGGGIKIKNLETINLGIPIIMTKFSAIGINKINTNAIITKNESFDFTDKLIEYYKKGLENG